MKKILILLITSSLFFSCVKSPEEKMKDNITTELKKGMNDPSTFEFVSMNIRKTITAGERKKFSTEAKLKEMIDKGLNPKLINQVKKEIDFLKFKDDDFEAIYFVDFVARGSNKMGAIVKNNYSATVLNDEDRTVVYFKSMD